MHCVLCSQILFWYCGNLKTLLWEFHFVGSVMVITKPTRILNIKGNWNWYLALPTHIYTVATYKAHKICMLYFSHHVLHSGWSYKYFCDFTIFVASGTHLTVAECLSIAFFGYHIPMHWSCIYLTCIHLANSYQPVWLYNLFLSFLLLHFFWNFFWNNWMRYWKISY